MARGDSAKKIVVSKLQAAFGADFIGESNKKYYVWSNENGEKIQIAITLTCPKVPVGVVNTSNELNFEDDVIQEVAPTRFEPVEITEEEHQKAIDLLAKLGF